MHRWGRQLLLHLAAAAFVIGGTAVAEAQTTTRTEAGKKTAAATRGDRIAKALPAPLDGQTARERVEDNVETGQVRVQRVYQDADGRPVIAIVVRSETPETLDKRRATFMDPKLVQAKKGEFRDISGQRFSILKVDGDYTAMTVVAERYSVLFYGTADRTTLFAFIVSTDFGRIAAAE